MIYIFIPVGVLVYLFLGTCVSVVWSRYDLIHHGKEHDGEVKTVITMLFPFWLVGAVVGWTMIGFQCLFSELLHSKLTNVVDSIAAKRIKKKTNNLKSNQTEVRINVPAAPEKNVADQDYLDAMEEVETELRGEGK